MRVLHIVPSLHAGGAQYMAVYLARQLAGEGAEVSVLSLWGPSHSRPEQMLAAAGIKTVFLDKRKGLDLRMFGRIGRALDEIKPHIVHTHLEGLRYAAPASLRRDIPGRVHTVHNMAEREVSGALRILHRLAFSRGFEVVSIAERVSESIQRTYGFAPRFMVPNGIDVDAFSVPAVGRSEWRRREGIHQDALVCTAVGRIEEQKDHATLVRAFASAFRGQQGYVLLIAGRRTHLAEAIESLAESLDIGDQVRLTGNRDDVSDMLHASDVFASSSRWEGNPLAVMEAMACGCPVVATSVGGVPELIENSGAGLLVGAGDEQGLRDALRRLSSEPSLRESMGRSAVDYARRHFDVQLMAERYLDIYKTLLGEGSSGAG